MKTIADFFQSTAISFGGVVGYTFAQGNVDWPFLWACIVSFVLGVIFRVIDQYDFIEKKYKA